MIPSDYRAVLLSFPYVLVAAEGEDLSDPNVTLYQWDLIAGRITDMEPRGAQVWLKFMPYAAPYSGDGSALVRIPE